MFEAFYKLSTNPFRLTPDPKFCFRHPSYNQAYAYLQYALRLGEGFIMVTGRPGIGKTTLAEVFLTEIEQSEVVAARIASANVETEDLLRVVAYSYGIDVAGLDKATILLNLEQFFVRQTRSGKRVLLIIDEAQGLPHIALEELRLLADLQMDSRPLLQLFLVGQEKLRTLMREPDMEQFQQRVIGACHLEPLDLQETRSYMEHRLRTAGWKGDPELSGAAVLSLYEYSKGIPRHVNKICTRLLLHGMMEEKHTLHKKDVLSVAEELRAEQLAPMERDDSADADSAETMPAELEHDSSSIENLALRMDPQEVSDNAAREEVTEPADAVEPLQGKRQPEAATSHRAAREGRPQARGFGGAAAVTEGPSWQRQRTDLGSSGISEFGGRLRGRPSRSRATDPRVEPGRQIRSRRPRRGRGSAVAGMFSRLKWKGKLALFVATVLVVNLALALLMTHLVEDGGDNKSLLVGYRQAVQEDLGNDVQHVEISRNGDGNHSGIVNRSSGGQEAAGPVVNGETGTTASQRQQFDSGRDDWFVAIEDAWDKDGIIANPRGRTPAKARSDTAIMTHQVQDRPLPESDSRMTVEQSGTETGAEPLESPAETVGQISGGESKQMMISGLQDSQSVSVVSLSAESDKGATAQTEQPAAPADRAKSDPAPQLMARTTLPAAVRTGPPDQTEQNTARPAFTRQDKIAELLSLGGQALKRDRLLIPTHDSAYKYYQQTLILEPGNDEALNGIERIVARYLELANKALAKQDQDKGRLYIDRGLSINPADKRLMALRDSMNKPAAVAEPKPPSVVQAEDQAPAAKPKPEPNDFLSRLKALFTKSRSTDKRKEVVVEER